MLHLPPRSLPRNGGLFFSAPGKCFRRQPLALSLLWGLFCLKESGPRSYLLPRVAHIQWLISAGSISICSPCPNLGQFWRTVSDPEFIIRLVDWDCISVQLSPSTQSCFFCLPSQDYSLINVLYSNLHLRVSFPNNPRCDTNTNTSTWC